MTAVHEFSIQVIVGPSSLTFDGSWNNYLESVIGHPVGHDGAPYVSDNFVVYSGFASTDARRQLAELAEVVYGELESELSTGQLEFEWATSDTKIDVFADKHQSDRCGQAYKEGFFVSSLDAAQDWCNLDSLRYRVVVKHELMHVIQGLLIGPDQPLGSPDTWFTEGIANHMSGGSPLDTILEWHQLETWRSAHWSIEGQGNPIAVHRWSDFPPEILDPDITGTYYPYFELAFRYLVDPNGLGKTLTDIKSIYFDIRAGMTFSDSFEQRMGMTIGYYEDRFWSLMRSYLN